jgi:hypothetical protein
MTSQKAIATQWDASQRDVPPRRIFSRANFITALCDSKGS